MARDIKINYEGLDDIRSKAEKYKIALETIDGVLKRLKEKLSDNSGEAISALLEAIEKIEEDRTEISEEVSKITKLLDDYILGMQESIKPLVPNKMVRVNRDDIWWNMKFIKDSCDSVIAKCLIANNEMSINGLSGMFDNEQEEFNKRENMKKLESISDLGKVYGNKLQQYKEELDKIFNSKVAVFEDKDDAYGVEANKLYKAVSSVQEQREDRREILVKEGKGILEGVGEVAKEIKEIPNYLLKGIVTYTGYGIGTILENTIGWTPSILKDDVERAEKYNSVFKQIFDNPSLVIEGFAQNVSDNYENKGIGFSIGNLSLDIADLFIGTKGIIKASKSLKIADKLDDSASIIKSAQIAKDVEKSLDAMRKSTDDFLKNAKGFLVDAGDRIYFTPKLAGLDDNFYYIDKIDLDNADELLDKANKEGRLFATTKGKGGVPFVSIVDRIKQYDKGKYATTLQIDHAKSAKHADILRAELHNQGVSYVPYDSAAHHIVARKDLNAAESRLILDKYGIDYDSAANGILLPRVRNNYVTTESMHSGGHLKDYHITIRNRLKEAESNAKKIGLSKNEIKEVICDELQGIRIDLLEGKIKIHD